MITITPEIRAAIEQSGDQPTRLVDPETHAAYVLLNEAEYQRLQSLNPPQNEDSVADLYPMSEEAFGQAGWDDPRMDDYDKYEAHRP